MYVPIQVILRTEKYRKTEPTNNKHYEHFREHEGACDS